MAISQNTRVHIIGFGSQGQAWAQNLYDSGANPTVYLSGHSSSRSKCQELEITLGSLDDLPNQLKDSPTETLHLVALLIPDHKIADFYQTYLAALTNTKLSVVLAHGYAVFNGSLKLASDHHSISLLAPKAIGPELRRKYLEAKKSQGSHSHHDLKAAFFCSKENTSAMALMASHLGFSENNLIVCPPETEALADLISEQGLLCGGLFTLLNWTIQTMVDADIPRDLIKEECITELGLIANLMKERGPVGTLDAISQAAAAGASLMYKELEHAGVSDVFNKQLKKIKSGEFVKEYESDQWKPALEELKDRLNKFGIK